VFKKKEINNMMNTKKNKMMNTRKEKETEGKEKGL
jgi:hypothetical protein